MDNYKFSVGQQVEVWKAGKKAYSGTIVKCWWYACQGFTGSPMYEVDCGAFVHSVDECDIRVPTLLATKSVLCPEGRSALQNELAGQRQRLRNAKQAVIEARKEIKRIKSLLGEK